VTSPLETRICVCVCVCIYSDISALQNRARAQTQAAKRCDALQYPATYCNTLRQNRRCASTHKPNVTHVCVCMHEHKYCGRAAVCLYIYIYIYLYTHTYFYHACRRPAVPRIYIYIICTYASGSWKAAAHYSTLQQNATHCNTLQHAYLHRVAGMLFKGLQ